MGMPQIIEGSLLGTNLRLAIVVSRTNDFITSRLLDGALDALRRHGVDEEAVAILRVPGCFEIPLVAQRLASSHSFDAVICLGAVIRGDTPHWEYISAEVTKGIAQVSLNTGVPVTFGVLTTDTVEQAIDRAGVKAGNKGSEAALAAIEMANLLRRV